MAFLSKIFRDPGDKKLSKYKQLVSGVNSRFEEYEKISDDELRGKTEEFKKRLKNGETTDDIMDEAFATVKQACKRLVGTSWEVREEDTEWFMVPFDEQIIGGITLHKGDISEMKTGEGKTLVATMPLYLNALEGKGAHLITVNEYLARRDAEWMGQVYRYLGLSVGVIERDQNREEKQEAYGCDITYGTNNEFGFDYLRDNMAVDAKHRVQRPLHYAIVDEVDSILVDEARTPLIISAPGEESTNQYFQFSEIVTKLTENEDYNIDEKIRATALTEAGITKLEKILGVDNIYEEKGIETVHHIEQALRAKSLFHRDKDYVIKDDQVIIVDQFTGRLMPGRRFSEGLHQALEAKEGLEVQQESKTMATITFQNYFRIYKKLSGMTGTAKTEEEEFQKIYNLDVALIPTHKDVVRDDKSDVIYKTEKAKFQAVANKIKELYEKGQPVLVGTVSVEKSESLSAVLKSMAVPHEVLNAKNHEREAKIISSAGERQAVTIATNMAGRGTDIKLGEGVVDVGGLYVIGTERHESRRIDNQLRGRSGRQGDPGTSQFYVSLDDDIMRIFGSDRIGSVMERLGLPDDQPIENKFITRSLESAQKKVEGNNFDVRKHVVEYDDVMNKHRETIYRKRSEVLDLWSNDTKYLHGGEDESKRDGYEWKLRKRVLETIEEEVEEYVSVHTMGDKEDKWDLEEISEVTNSVFPIPRTLHEDLLKIKAEKKGDVEGRTSIIKHIMKLAKTAYEKREEQLGDDNMRQIERAVTLRTIDTLWIDHLVAMERLREGVRLSGYGQRDPLVEYKREGYRLFQKLLSEIQKNITTTIYKVQIMKQEKTSPMEDERVSTNTSDDASSSKPKKSKETVGRNDPCHCGSGKKYKKCHGKNK
ncbi:preprotein translocase subunit SecA [Patescibacteria group bacterium]